MLQRSGRKQIQVHKGPPQGVFGGEDGQGAHCVEERLLDGPSLYRDYESHFLITSGFNYLLRQTSGIGKNDFMAARHLHQPE